MCGDVLHLFSCLFGHVNLSLLKRRVHPRRRLLSAAVSSWPYLTDMESNYDEDVTENQFLRTLREEYKHIFQQAAHEGWVICVPRHGSFAEDILHENCISSHILIPSDDAPFNKFHTLTGKDVSLINKKLTMKDDNETCSTHLLFEETFYTEDMCKYHVWCIEQPLICKLLNVKDRVTVVTNLQQAMDLLWEGLQDKSLIKELDASIKKCKCSHKDLESKPLEEQREIIASLYANCLGILLNDSELKDKSAGSRHFLQSIKTSVETYILYALRSLLPRSVSTATAKEDARLNKIIRNSRELQLKDLGVRTDLYNGVQRGKLELSRLDRVFTVLEKIECLKRAVHYISEAASAVSSDDLLPVLIFLVIRTGVPNWIAQLVFMKQFRFSVNSTYEADEANFLITSLEAALEHIKSGVLTDSFKILVNHPEELLELPQNFRFDNEQKDKSLGYLFLCIKSGNLSEVEAMLSNNNLTSPAEVALCHPLCTCETCERNLAKNNQLDSLTVCSTDDKGFTALHVAASCGQVTIVDYLLNHGANPNVRDNDGITPLHCASTRGYQNTTLLLLHANADPGVLSLQSNTPLHLATDHGHEGCVKALLYFAEQMRIPLDVSPANVNGDTPLHHASKWGYEGIVKILVEYGANCKATNKRGQTPLTVAHSKRVSDILEQRATLESVDACSKTYYQSQQSKKITYTDLQLDESRNKLDHKCSPNLMGQHTVDRLLSAIAAGDVCLAYYYLGLENRNDRTTSRTDYCHPLCTCEHCGSLDESLDKTRKSPPFAINACNSNNETALHVASANGCTEIVQLLLDAGANINVTTKSEGRTPLHLACVMNMTKVVKILLNSAICDINARDKNGDTPLHLAATAGNVKLVELLMRYDADPRVRNLQGLTPIQQAEKEASNDAPFPFSEVLKLLKRNSLQNTKH